MTLDRIAIEATNRCAKACWFCYKCRAAVVLVRQGDARGYVCGRALGEAAGQQMAARAFHG